MRSLRSLLHSQYTVLLSQLTLTKPPIAPPLSISLIPRPRTTTTPTLNLDNHALGIRMEQEQEACSSKQAASYADLNPLLHPHWRHLPALSPHRDWLPLQVPHLSKCQPVLQLLQPLPEPLTECRRPPVNPPHGTAGEGWLHLWHQCRLWLAGS